MAKKKKAARPSGRVDPNADMKALVAQQCRRNCCMCYGLKRQLVTVEGQLAHLDGDSSNTVVENLAYLCQPCHTQFDTKTNRVQGFTPQEVKFYQAELFRVLRTNLSEWTITVRAIQTEYDTTKAAVVAAHAQLKTTCPEVTLNEAVLR